MKRRRHVRRRLVLLVASVLPLLADDVVVVAPPSQPLNAGMMHPQLPVGGGDTNDDMSDDISKKLPQHVMNRAVAGDSPSTNDDDADTDAAVYRLYHRKTVQGDQQWVEEVWLPITLFNASTTVVVPFYPFEFDTGVDVPTTVTDGTATTTAPFRRSGNRTTADNDDVSSNQRLPREERHLSSSDRVKLERSDTITATTIGDTDDSVTATTAIASDGSDPHRPTVSSSTTTTTPLKQRVSQHVEVDYASKSAGAVILDSSPNSFQGVSNLLQQDRDKYAIVPCGSNSGGDVRTASTMMEPKYVVIGLSEDILVKQFAIANYERYSSHMKEIRLYGSVSTNAIRQPSHWIHLGDFMAQRNTNQNEKQTFDLIEPTWARYLKVEFTSHYGEEYYCTISQISVHGSTVLQGFHEQWNEENNQNNNNNEEEDESSNRNHVVAERSTESPSTNDTTVTLPERNSGSATHTHSLRTSSHLNNNNIKVNETDMTRTNATVKHSASEKSGGSTTMSTTMPTIDRYNFSRMSGCRSSLSFEEHLLYHTSLNKSISDSSRSSNEQSPSLMSSRPLRSSTSFTNLCATTTKTAVIPSKRSVRKVQVRHTSRTPEPLSSNGLSRNVASSHPPSRHLSQLSLSLERVTDFLRSAVEGFHNGNNAMPNHLSLVDESVSTSTTANEEIDDALVSSDGIHEAATESDVATRETVHTNDSNSDEEFLESNGLMLAKLLTRLPSAKCLEDLNFADYKSHKSASSSKSRNGSSSGPQSSNGGGGGGGSSNAATNMEPIFKKLTDEIKALQSNLMIHDQFAKESMSCYQRVILDMLVEMEAERRSYDVRLTKLEGQIHITTFLVASRRLASRMITAVWYYFNNSLMSLFLMNQSMDTDRIETTVSLATLLLFGAIVLSTYMITALLRRYRNGTVTKPKEPNESNVIQRTNIMSFQYDDIDPANHHSSEDDDDSSAEILPVSPVVVQQPLTIGKDKANTEQ